MRLQLNNLAFKILTNDPIIRNIRITQGDTFILDMFFVDIYSYFFPHNMMGAKVLFTAKRLISETDGNAAIKHDTVPNPSGLGGEVILRLTSEMTKVPAGNYIYSVKVVEINGNITKVMYGNLCIELDPTQREDNIYEA